MGGNGFCMGKKLITLENAQLSLAAHAKDKCIYIIMYVSPWYIIMCV